MALLLRAETTVADGAPNEARKACGAAMKHFLITAALLALCVSGAHAASERVGTATLVRTAVTGNSGPVAVKTPIHRNERIRTSKSGLGEFLFRDGTKLAVGWGSVVTIDKFVFDDDNTADKLAIKVTKGTFRWISGKSRSTAYEIKTPAGTIGVRGTKFDFFVDGDGTTAIVMLSGSARFCGAGGCVTLSRRCDCVVARPGRRPATSRANRQLLTELGEARALPFLSGDQKLSGSFGANSGCGMTARAQQEPG